MEDQVKSVSDILAEVGAALDKAINALSALRDAEKKFAAGDAPKIISGAVKGFDAGKWAILGILKNARALLPKKA